MARGFVGKIIVSLFSKKLDAKAELKVEEEGGKKASRWERDGRV